MLKAFQPAEFLAVVQRERQVARRMAFAAMGQRLREIRAPVPLRTLRRVRFEAGIGIEQDDQKIIPHRWLNENVSVFAGATACIGARLKR
jgi:hypothetical protein